MKIKIWKKITNNKLLTTFFSNFLSERIREPFEKDEGFSLFFFK